MNMEMTSWHSHIGDPQGNVWKAHCYLSEDGTAATEHLVNVYVMVGSQESSGNFCVSEYPPMMFGFKPLGMDMGLESVDEDGNPCPDISFPLDLLNTVLALAANIIYGREVASDVVREALRDNSRADDSDDAPSTSDTGDLDKLWGGG